jgi:hypothetical protein
MPLENLEYPIKGCKKSTVVDSKILFFHMMPVKVTLLAF